MKISNKIIEQIGSLIAGEAPFSTPYLSGRDLVNFYNECGYKDIYDNDFPSRCKYSSGKILESNGTSTLTIILEEITDPRRYGGDDILAERIAGEINNLIRFDNFQLIKRGEFFKVTQKSESIIQPESISRIDQEFLLENIEKCQSKIINKDYNGAITNARTMCEIVMIYIIENIEKVEVKNDGNVINLWSRTKKALKIDLQKNQAPEFVIQVLSGLSSTINGLSGISNNAGDRHANKFKTKRHHAKLAVNASITFCEFLIDIINTRE